MNNVAHNFESTGYTPETIRNNEEDRWRIELGSLAIEKCQLGVNDELTHLCAYIRNGEESLNGIREDAKTDFSERIKNKNEKNLYILNKLKFEFNNKTDDFISVNDKVSMKSMTKNNFEAMKKISLKGDPQYFMEIARAKAEIEEVDKLAKWFKNAPIGSNLVFESLPIGVTEKYAFTRIYQKIDNSSIEGCFVSLHNSSIDQFNDLRKELGVNAENENEIDILQNCYQINKPELKNSDETIRFYVDNYDQLLFKKNNKAYSFGIEQDDEIETYNSLEKVEKAMSKVDIYIDAIKSIADSNGIVTPEIISLDKDFGKKDQEPMKLREKLSVKSIKDLLNNIIFSIASSITNSSIEELEACELNKQSNRKIVSNHGNTSRANGESYEGGGCPTFENNNNTTESSDSDMISTAFRLVGEIHDGVCRIKGCPSGGRTVRVGGCSICMHCHALFQQGKNPEQVYKQQKEDKEKEESKAKKIQDERESKSRKLAILTDDERIYRKKAKSGNIYYIRRHESTKKEIKELQEAS
ncbi:MAG: hypothetical protein PWQ10_524 [Patescibacteria group bacterium]|nr:hypothetical protein [Patescibacteria group bacterium]